MENRANLNVKNCIIKVGIFRHYRQLEISDYSAKCISLKLLDIDNINSPDMYNYNWSGNGFHFSEVVSKK